MSSKENHHDDEAEFEEFLQGRGELARHLQALPQDTPSPALDAAIFAKVEAALKSGAPAPVLAANDADIPEAAGKPAAVVSGNPSFRQRWWRGAPLATAASVAIVGFLGLQWRHQLELDSPAPVYTPAPAVQAPPVSAAPRNEPQAAPPQAQAPAESFTKSPAAMSPAPAQLAEKSPAKAVSRPAPAQDAISVPAASVPAAPAMAGKLAATDIAAAKPEQARSGDSPAEAWQTKKMEISGTRFSQAPSGTASLAAQAAPPSAAVAVPVPQPALRSVPAPVDAAPAAIEATSGYARQAGAADARVAAPYASHQPSAPTVLSEKQAAEAKERLDLIEELLKAGLRRDALNEWDKFRKAYPDYPVPDSITEKIRGLQK